MEQRDFARELDEFEKALADAKLAYEKFFAGIERREPQELRQKLQRMSRALTAQFTSSTQLRYRLNTLIGRLTSFTSLWDRIISQMEMGTYQPDKFKAHIHEQKKFEPRSSKLRPEDSTPSREKTDAGDERRIYGEFLESRKKNGEPTNVSFEKFQEALGKQRSLLEERFQNKKVGFKVAVENGKTKIKGFAAK